MDKASLEREKVCIILLTYFNNGDTIGCVRSVLASSPDECPFIVVVDNSDVRSTLEEDLSFYPDLKYLFPGTNMGFAGGVNYGVGWAIENLTFEYLFILNNDTVLASDTLRKLIMTAEANSSVTIFAPCIITDEQEPRIWYAGGKMNFYRMTPVISNIGKIFRESDLKNELTSFASGCAMFLAADKVDLKKGLFDPFFFMYDEDVELTMRIHKTGGSIYFVSDSLVTHKCQGSQQKETGKKINQLAPGNLNLNFYLENTIKNRYYIIDRYFRGVKRLELFFTLTGYWLLKCLQFFLNFNFKASGKVLKELSVCLTGKLYGTEKAEMPVYDK
jgi:GT2 family glycosyltransferase